MAIPAVIVREIRQMSHNQPFPLTAGSVAALTRQFWGHRRHSRKQAPAPVKRKAIQ